MNFAYANDDLAIVLNKASESNQDFISQKVELQKAAFKIKSQYGAFLPSVSVEVKKSDQRVNNNFQQLDNEISETNLKASYNLFYGI